MARLVQEAEEKAGEPKGRDSGTDVKSTTVYETVPRSVWSGSLSMGLVNIPVKVVPLTRDMRISLRMLHRSCKTPISYRKFCQEGEEVAYKDIVYGYRLEEGKYVVLEKREIERAKPESSRVIELDSFVNFFQIDPHHFEKTYLLVPSGSEEAYSLLRKVMEKTGRAAIGRMTFSSQEHIVLVHYYRNAVVATTLRYKDEILDPERFKELEDLPEPGEKELALAREIVDRLTGEIDLSAYEDTYRHRIEALVSSKLGREVVKMEKKKRKPAAKNLMEALRETADSLK